jgi:hypothetical protein
MFVADKQRLAHDLGVEYRRTIDGFSIIRVYRPIKVTYIPTEDKVYVLNWDRPF